MTLEDRLEQLANRTPPSDPGEVMARARAQADSRPDARRPRLLAAAAVIAAIVLAAGALALTGGDEDDSVTVAGPDGNPAQLQPSCDEITRFADSLNDTGIDYDYSASSSPQELASWSDAVFTGTLTETVSEVTDEESRLDYVGFEVQVTESFNSDGLPSGETVTVLLRNGAQRSGDHWADLVPPGAPVVVFAHVPADRAPDAGTSVVANGVEGIITACEDGPPLGLVGTGGDWPSLRTLADIEGALTSKSGNRTEGQGGVDGPVMYAPASDGAMEQALLSGVLARRGDCLYVAGRTPNWMIASGPTPREIRTWFCHEVRPSPCPGRGHGERASSVRRWAPYSLVGQVPLETTGLFSSAWLLALLFHCARPPEFAPACEAVSWQPEGLSTCW